MEPLIRRIASVLAAGPAMRLAVLFGSHALGRATSTSDIDLAIVPTDSSLSLTAELDLAAQLSLTLRREVDLVRLDRASTLLRWEIARDGVNVVADPAWEWVRFRALAASDHAEIREALHRAAELFRRRVTRSVV